MTLHLGMVRPGSTIYIPFDTFAGSTGASVTMSGLAVTDVEIYKNGSVTQRSSDTGYTLLDTDGIDFDGLTGIHGFSIDLSSNADSGFFVAGGFFWVVVSAITVDTQTVSFVAATFEIGYPDALINTTIATLSTQTSFTLTAGPAEDDALNGCTVVIHDIASAVQLGKAIVSDYTGSTKTVTLVAGVTFTAAAGDNISIFLPTLQPTAWGRTLDVSTGGEAGVDWANVGSPTTTVGLTGTTVDLVANAVDATAIANDAITAAKIATGAIDADAIAADAVAEIADGVWDEDATGHQTQGTFGQAIGDPVADSDTIWGLVNTNLNATISSRASQTSLDTLDDYVDTEIAGIITTLGTPAGASISADIAAIEAQTDDIGAAGAGLTAIPWNAAWDTEVESEATDALNAYDPPTRAEATADKAEILAKIQGFILESGTIGATGNDTTHVHISGFTYGDDEINNYLLVIYDVSEDEYHARYIEDWVNSTKLVTVATLPFTPQASTDGYFLLPFRQDVTGGAGLDAAGVRAAVGLASANLDTQLAAIDDAVDTEVAAIITTLGTPAGASISADILTIDNLVDDLESRLGTPSNLGSGASIAANLVDIEGQTDDIGVAGAGLTAVPWNAAWDTEVQSEAEDALVAHRLDELLNADSDIDGAAPPTVGSVFHELMSKTAGSFTFDQTTDSNEAIRDRGDAAWTTATGFSTLTQADIRTAVGLASANLDTQLSAIAGYIDTEVTAILARIGSFTGTGVNTILGFFQALMRSDSTTPSDLGGTYDDATDSLQALRDNVGTNGASLTLAKTTNITGFNDLSAAQVNAEVLDVLVTDTFAEPSAVPAATSSIKDKLNWLFALARNKITQTSSTQTLRNDADSGNIATASVSDDATTATRAEWS